MSAAPESRRVDLARVTLGVLLIGGLLFTTFWLVRPGPSGSTRLSSRPQG